MVLFALVAGCIPAPVYRVQRTARVPHPAAPLRTGEPLAGPLELSIGASNAGDAREPTLTDHDASIEVPSTQVRGELRIRLGQRGELTGLYERGLASTTQRLDPTQASVARGAPKGGGVGARYAIQLADAPGLSIGLGLEAMIWSIPYVEYRTCVEFCAENDAPINTVTRGAETVATAGFSVTPTYRSGAFAVFAGVYGRRHPTIVRKGTELYVDANDRDRDVDGGPYNWLVHAGVEYRLPSVSLLLSVHQDLTRAPVAYGPSIGFAVAIRLPDLPTSPFSPTPASATQPGIDPRW